MTVDQIGEALRAKGLLVTGSSVRLRGAHEAADRVTLLCVGTSTWSRVVQLLEVSPEQWEVALVTPDGGHSLAEYATRRFQTGKGMPIGAFLRMNASDMWVHLGHDEHQNNRLARL